MRNTREHNSWVMMLQRCNNPNASSYEYYGGRGISVCRRWQTSFANFYADMGPRPPGTTLDRINNDGHYEPGNCRWSTIDVQNNNHRRIRLITFRGRTRTLTQWAREVGVSQPLLNYRINTGAPFG